MKYGVLMLMLMLTALRTVASADILAWTDSTGVTHYTNLKGEVPPQQAVEVVVDEQVWLPQDSALPVAKEDPAVQPQPPLESQSDILRAYLVGLESGLSRDVSTGASVYISGPLAVTISAPTPYSDSLLPGYDWQLWGYYPYLATSVIGWHRRSLPGGFGTGFHKPFPFYRRFNSPAGPPPFGAAGPPPFGAAGPPPLGAAARPTVWAAGRR